MAEKTLVFLKDIHKTYNKVNWVLQGVDLRLNKGDIIKIIGEEGSGKTTLLKIILCAVFPDRGRVNIMDIDTSDLKKYEHILLLRQYMAVFFENFRLFEYMTVLDNLLFINKMKGRKKRIFMPLVERFLSQLDLGDIFRKEVVFLSPGEKARLALAMIFSLDTPIILMDEPFRYLSPSSIGKAIDILKSDFCEDKGIILFSGKEISLPRGKSFILNSGKLYGIHNQDTGQK
ncbi:MAG: ATP-binding cassette domain-containing protein [Deltaproteobacteria bacterium]|nr:ATP-binding cassette domain-containing protein [Deltaproteobacteria bacterium]